MIFQHSTFSGVSAPSQICPPLGQWRKQTNLILHHQLPLLRLRDTRSSSSKITCFAPGLFDAFAQLASNKVLIAACASALVGQLVKPLTSVLLYGRKFDIRSVIDTGGFPSTHSSATVASATLVGLERGFSDPIFGLTFVYAGLIMYDAQGVRKEVGSHAKLLNKLVIQMQLNSVTRSKIRSQGSLSTSRPGASTHLNSQEQEASSLDPTLTNASSIINPITQIDGGELSAEALEVSKLVGEDCLMSFKESVGHTSNEVFGGAVLGFLVGLLIHNFWR
ncbi:hypothetical protein K1719_012568 [Acacia pycnantha]|nr:hypothetical protein K1719_012568 [Acacia pycnantha]